jgi:hypothetical protein
MGWMAMMEEEYNKKKEKEKKGCGWFSGLFGRKKKNSERIVDGGLSQVRILDITSTQTKCMDAHTFTQRQI